VRRPLADRRRTRRLLPGRASTLDFETAADLDPRVVLPPVVSKVLIQDSFLTGLEILG